LDEAATFVGHTVHINDTQGLSADARRCPLLREQRDLPATFHSKEGTNGDTTVFFSVFCTYMQQGMAKRCSALLGAPRGDQTHCTIDCAQAQFGDMSVQFAVTNKQPEPIAVKAPQQRIAVVDQMQPPQPIEGDVNAAA